MKKQSLVHSDLADPIRDYDAHIYFTEKTQGLAEKLREKLIAQFSGKTLRVGPLFNEWIGPHTAFMFELNFTKENLEPVLSYLFHHRDNLSVLIHEVTDNDPRDHTLGAIWLGKKVELDFSKLSPVPEGSCRLQSDLFI